MQAFGLIVLFLAGAAGVTALSVSLYVRLPQALLDHAQRHGRFQGLAEQETLARGTRAGEPPARPLVLEQQSA